MTTVSGQMRASGTPGSPGLEHNPDKKTANVVGVLFVVATTASILGSAVLGSALDGSNYLVGIAGQEASVLVAVLLFVIAATSAFGTAVLLFPILRRRAEGLAAAYVGLRTFENVFYVAGAVALLVMLSVSQDAPIDGNTDAGVRVVGATLLALHHWSVLLGTLIFAGLGSLTLNYMLYRATLVPRWMSAWGVVGAALLIIYGLIGMLDGATDKDSPLILLAMPIAVEEMVFAVWLMVKGFERHGGIDESSPSAAPDAPGGAALASVEITS